MDEAQRNVWGEGVWNSQSHADKSASISAACWWCALTQTDTEELCSIVFIATHACSPSFADPVMLANLADIASLHRRLTLGSHSTFCLHELRKIGHSFYS